MLKHMLGSVLALGAAGYLPTSMPMLHDRIPNGPVDRYPVDEMRRRGLAWAGDGVEPEGAGEPAHKRKALQRAARIARVNAQLRDRIEREDAEKARIAAENKFRPFPLHYLATKGK